MARLKSAARGAVSVAARATSSLVPAKARRFIAESWEAGAHTERVYSCPVCDTATGYFKPFPREFINSLAEHEYAHPVFQTETLNFTHYMCPNCGASDRDRLYALYLKSRLADLPNGYRFIDFAPAAALSKKLRAMPGISYRSADLFDKRADDVIDITEISYPDASADVFLCSHVLEHVQADTVALRELYRILKPGGFGILMVPLINGVEQTLENPLIVSEADRWKWFGQNDHVRQYAKTDFVRRIECAGFTVSQLGIEHFGAETFARHGIHTKSVLYVGDKQI